MVYLEVANLEVGEIEVTVHLEVANLGVGEIEVTVHWVVANLGVREIEVTVHLEVFAGVLKVLVVPVLEYNKNYIVLLH